MFKTDFNTKQQGNVGVAAAILFFSQCGNTISIPLNDSQDYDIVVDINGILQKVQVKTTNYKNNNGVYIVQLRSAGGTSGTTYHRVADGSCDLLFILTGDGSQYLLPREQFQHNRSTINLSAKYSSFKVK